MAVIDQVLIMGILELLAVVGDHGRPLDPLAGEVALRIDRRTLTRAQVETALIYAKGKGWVKTAVDEAWAEDRWFITTAGSNRAAM